VKPRLPLSSDFSDLAVLSLFLFRLLASHRIFAPRMLPRAFFHLHIQFKLQFIYLSIQRSFLLFVRHCGLLPVVQSSVIGMHHLLFRFSDPRLPSLGALCYLVFSCFAVLVLVRYLVWFYHLLFVSILTVVFEGRYGIP
jgi:hypothetical protein